MAVSCKFWGQYEEDDITKLPQDYEAKVADDNRVYFLNHSKEETQWQSPLNGIRYKVMPGLPYGWQKFKDNEERLVYVDHLSQMCISVDPRLITKAVYDFPLKYGIKNYPSVQNFFRPLVKSAEILKDVDLDRKVVMVTGANSGLGYQTALHLAEKGALVILACRNSSKAEEAIAKIRTAHPGANVEFMHLDLSALSSIRTFAQEFISRDIPLHVLVCNAGVFRGNYGLTTDGFEQHFGVNHLGHFYLCKLLLPVLLRSKPSKVVMVTSESHWYPTDKSSQLDLQSLHHVTPARYRPITAYGASKLCNLLFSLEFSHRYAEKGVACNAVHPGNLLPTGLCKGAGVFYRVAFALARPFTKSVDQAASTIVYCAGHPSMKRISGLYMHECWPVEPSPEAQDPHTATALWELSEKLVAERTGQDSGVSVESS